MKIALIDKNPKTQFAIGHDHPVFTNLSSLSEDLNNYKPDWVFISIKHGMDQIRNAIKNTKAAYIYADYTDPLPPFTIQLSQMSDITLTTWKNPKLWKHLKNPHVGKRATDSNQFYPIPEIKPIHDVVFAGNNFGGKPRMEVMEFLNKHFDLFIVGGGWPPKFKQHGRQSKSYVELNRLLNTGKITVGAFNLIDKAKTGVSYYTSNRPFQNMAIGRPHITPHSPGVEEYFEKGYLDYDNLSSLRIQIETLLLASQEQRDEIGKIQREEIVTRHNYIHAWEHMRGIIEKNLFSRKN
jgi:hypothetical protein